MSAVPLAFGGAVKTVCAVCLLKFDPTTCSTRFGGIGEALRWRCGLSLQAGDLDSLTKCWIKALRASGNVPLLQNNTSSVFTMAVLGYGTLLSKLGSRLNTRVR